mgnify:CR=1 FL=1
MWTTTTTAGEGYEVNYILCQENQKYYYKATSNEL